MDVRWELSNLVWATHEAESNGNLFWESHLIDLIMQVDQERIYVGIPSAILVD